MVDDKKGSKIDRVQDESQHQPDPRLKDQETKAHGAKDEHQHEADEKLKDTEVRKPS